MANAMINGTLNGSVIEDNENPATGVVTVTDDDMGENTLAQSNVGTHQGSFGTLVIDGSGNWTYSLSNELAVVQSLAAGATRTDTFAIASADGTASAEIVITITGANDAPHLAAAIVSNVNEGDASYVLDLLGGASDADEGQTATLSIDNVMYTVNGSTATATAPVGLTRTGTALAVDASVSAFDSLAAGETKNILVSYDVVDVSGGSAAQTATITITGVNDAPTSAHDTATVTEDTAKTLAVSDFGAFADADSGDSLKAVKIGALPAKGVLALDGIAVTAGQLIAAADISASKLVYTPAANDSTDQSLTFCVVDQSNAESASYTLTLDLIAVNDAPTGTVTISGTALTGNTLTVSNTLADVDGINGLITYQWKVDGAAIDQATNSTFVVSNAQAGKIISVTASYLDNGGTLESVTKAMTVAAGGVMVATESSSILKGSTGDDVLSGNRSTKTFIGGAGNDTYIVRGHSTVVENVGEGIDTVVSERSFTLGANVENLTLSNDSAKKAVGNALDNIVIGNANRNTLSGLGGADTLTGGAGRDKFVYRSVDDSKVSAFDTITDFNAADGDVINLQKIDANVNLTGDQAFKFIGTAHFSDYAGVAGLLRFDTATHMLQASVDADSDAEFAILLVGVASITEANIVL